MGTIQFKKVNKVYPNGFHAIYDFTLDIADGEFIVFVGPSGCGKSTVLRMLAGLEEISGGELWLDGRKINDSPPYDRDIAMVFQDYALYGNMSIYDNIGMSLRVRHEDKAVIYDKVMDAAGTVGLMEYLKRLPGQLSGGQKQRVALGRAIVREPKAFLMDEPLSNLDAKMRNSTRVDLIKLQRQLGVTTIYVTHDQVEAMTMADRMVVMKDGYIQQVGTTMEIYDDPANMFVAGFIGTPPMNFIKGILTMEGFTFGEYRMTLSPKTMDALRAYHGRELVLGLRPEEIALTDSCAENALAGTLDSREYLGNTYILHILLGDEKITCQVPRTNKPLDEAVYVCPRRNHMYFFDPETTMAVYHAKEGELNG